MKLLTFLVADYANLSQEMKLNVMGIFNQINAHNFPARHQSLYVVIKLAPDFGEYAGSRSFTLRLLDSDGGEVFSLTGPILIPETHGGRQRETQLILQLRDLVFPAPGTYAFVVLIDNRQVGDELPIELHRLELDTNSEPDSESE